MARYGIFDKMLESVVIDNRGNALVFLDKKQAENFIKNKKDLEIIEI